MASYNKELNPKLWKDGQLIPEVRNQILKISDEFVKYLQVPISVADIQLVGSNASYNYSDTSDLDVHVIANFDVPGISPEALKLLCDVEKTSFNKKYDIFIKGIEVEMYVQDVNSGIASNGIYSVIDNRWIKDPVPLEDVPVANVEREFNKWQERIEEILQEGNYEKIEAIINRLYMIRTNSIAIDGEYGKGNQLFKKVRAAGLLQKLKDAQDMAFSKKLSLESLSKGQLVNRNLD